MPVGVAWNAGAVRARLIARRRMGPPATRDLARRASMDEALTTLRQGPYGHDVHPDMTLTTALWAVGATPLWHLRILAGWLPPAGAELIRVLVGWWEVLNVERLLAGPGGSGTAPAYDLGRLDTAWKGVRSAASAEEVRAALAVSEWREPASADVATIVTWLQLSWCQRVADQVEGAARLAAGWAALVVARGLLEDGGAPPEEGPHPVRLLGTRWMEATDVSGLARRLPREARWILSEVDDPRDLWRAEVRWWRTLEREADALLRRPGSGPDAAVGAFGVLLSDAHRVQGALELAARGGGSDEEIDELL